MIKHYTLTKKYVKKKLLKEFPEKNWSKTGLRKLLNKTDDTRNTKRQRKTTNVSIRCKHWHCLKTDFKSGEWPRYPSQPMKNWNGNGNTTSICSSNCRNWPRFNTFNTNKCTTINQRRRKETKWERKKAIALHDTCQFRKKTFTDEKIFKLQALNNMQHDSIYGVNLSHIKEKGHSEKNKFSISVMVSIGVSKLRKTSIHFDLWLYLLTRWSSCKYIKSYTRLPRGALL